MAHADVIVVGGGAWGLSVAWHLASGHGVSVQVLERRALPGLETSGQAAGQLGQVREQPVARDAARYALEFAASLARRRDPASFVRSGSVTLVETEAAAARLRARFASASAAGVTVDAVSGADAALLVPGLIGDFAAHYFVPTDGYVDPPRHLAALAADAASFGVDVRCATTVVELHVEGDRVLGVQTTDGLMSAGTVLLAAGPWTGALPILPATRLAAQPIPLRQARTATCGVGPDHPVVRFPEAGAYVRPERAGYLFGAFHPPFEPLPDELPRDAHTEHVRPDTAHSDATKTRLARWIPALGRLPIDHHRQGWTTFTPDGLPLAGRHPVLSNLWLATGCGAMGFVWAPALGRWLAQSIVENEAIPLLEPLDPSRCGAHAHDRSWVRDEGVRRYHDYYGIATMASGSDLEGPSAEHYAWK